jgi:hypothetical protein
LTKNEESFFDRPREFDINPEFPREEKLQRYNNEAMIPPKLGDVWIPKILIAIGKESQHAILNLGSSVNILSKELYDLLDLD